MEQATEHKTSAMKPRIALEWAQLTIAVVTLLGGVFYIGGRSEADHQQAKTLATIASDLTTLKERNADANTHIKVLTERVAQVEKRLERMESK